MIDSIHTPATDREIETHEQIEARYARAYPPGTLVTCKVAISAHYSNYGGRPEIMLQPGTPCRVHASVPKVRMTAPDTAHDDKGYFLVVDFHSATTKQIERAGLNFINVAESDGARDESA